MTFIGNRALSLCKGGVSTLPTVRGAEAVTRLGGNPHLAGYLAVAVKNTSQAGT
jgi:hypothetical protein